MDVINNNNGGRETNITIHQKNFEQNIKYTKK